MPIGNRLIIPYRNDRVFFDDDAVFDVIVTKRAILHFQPKLLYLFQAICLLFIDIVDILFHLFHAFEALLPAQFPDRVVHLFTAVGAFTAGKDQAGEKDKE